MCAISQHMVLTHMYMYQDDDVTQNENFLSNKHRCNHIKRCFLKIWFRKLPAREKLSRIYLEQVNIRFKVHSRLQRRREYIGR